MCVKITFLLYFYLRNLPWIGKKCRRKRGGRNGDWGIGGRRWRKKDKKKRRKRRRWGREEEEEVDEEKEEEKEEEEEVWEEKEKEGEQEDQDHGYNILASLLEKVPFQQGLGILHGPQADRPKSFHWISCHLHNCRCPECRLYICSRLGSSCGGQHTIPPLFPHMRMSEDYHDFSEYQYHTLIISLIKIFSCMKGKRHTSGSL